MKITPMANNHIHLELDNGDILDINDGTNTEGLGILAIKNTIPANYDMVVGTEVDTVRIVFMRKW